jgi:hypothetical protein
MVLDGLIVIAGKRGVRIESGFAGLARPKQFRHAFQLPQKPQDTATFPDRISAALLSTQLPTSTHFAGDWHKSNCEGVSLKRPGPAPISGSRSGLARFGKT